MDSIEQYKQITYRHMAVYNKAHVSKATLVVCCLLLILLNLLSSRDEIQTKVGFSLRQLRSSFSTQPHSNNGTNASTLIWDGDNTTAKNIPLHSLLEVATTRTIASDATTETDDSADDQTTKSLKLCHADLPNRNGPIKVNTTIESIKLIEERYQKVLLPGGWYRPKDCRARDRVAIIVPFRDRYEHLSIFLKNLHPFLMKQNIEYGLFIIEQTHGQLFNRAALMNVGFLEALKLYDWNCFIFHDIDLLPIDHRNLYTCPDEPRHMSITIYKNGVMLPYTNRFGGVAALTNSQIRAVNGFSNSFWGWGAEDNDMTNRLKHAHYNITKYPENIGRYIMLNHKKEEPNPKRFSILRSGEKKFNTDGLNSIEYEVYMAGKLKLFTWFLVDIKQPERR